MYAPNRSSHNKWYTRVFACALSFCVALTSTHAYAGTASESRTNTTNTAPAPTSGSGAADSAKQSQGTQTAVAGISAAIGVGMIAYGTSLLPSPPTQPTGVMLIGMGLMSLAQAASLLGTGKGAGNAGNAMSSGYGGFSGFGGDADCPGCSTDPSSLGEMAGLTPDQVAALNKAKADLAAQGVTIQGGKINSKGKSYALSNFGSAEGLKSMGFSDADISNAMNQGKEIAAKAADKAKFAALSADGGGGGAARAAANAPADPGIDYDKLFGKNKNAKDKKEASVAGMSKKYGSDNIGVAGDNIFEMINRRYKAYDERKSFIEGEQ